jgi:hypothetical protein
VRDDEPAGSKPRVTTQSPEAAASPTPAEVVSFTSGHYRYSIRYPEAGPPTEATRSLGGSEPTLPGEPSVDTLRTPEGIILVGAQRVKRGTTVRDWAADTEHLIRGTGVPTCAEPAGRERTRVGGESARLLLYPSCDGKYILWVTLIHNREAFVISWQSELGAEDADRALFETALASFKFES